jgi:hypothetical protein
MMMPSSMTRLVEANWNAIAAVKLAPLRKIDRAKATAAYEHDEEAAPRPEATHSERGESSGSSRLISPLDTTACTIPDSAKPRMSAQRISQNIPKAKLSASSKASNRSAMISSSGTERRRSRTYYRRATPRLPILPPLTETARPALPRRRAAQPRSR